MVFKMQEPHYPDWHLMLLVHLDDLLRLLLEAIHLFCHTQVHWPFTAYEKDDDEGHKRGDLRHTRELTPTFKETWQAMEKLVEKVCSSFCHVECC